MTDGFRCLQCGGDRYCTLRTRRLYQCNRCHHQTSLVSGTLFEQTKLPLTLWFLAIHLITQSKTGLSALALMRQHSMREASKAITPVPHTHRQSLGLVLGTSDIGASYSAQAVTQSQSVYKAAAPQKSILNATKARSEGLAPGEGAGKLDQA